MARLTKSIIDRIKPPATGYSLHWCEQDRGFALRVTATGKQTFIVQGRVNGKKLRITIGPFGIFTVEQAREGSLVRFKLDPQTSLPAQLESVAAAVATGEMTVEEGGKIAEILERLANIRAMADADSKADKLIEAFRQFAQVAPV